MAPIKSCGFLIIRGDPIQSFLMMIHPQRLDLPKGHVDPGESELQCALRELEEETGIGAHDVEVLPDFRFVTSYEVCNKRSGYQPGRKMLIIFLGRLRRDVPIVPSEHQDYRWIPWQPPHRLQPQTIDPLLAEVERYFHSR